MLRVFSVTMLRQSVQGLVQSAGLLQQGLKSCSYSTQQAFSATLFPGDGVGPEIAEAAKKVFAAAGVPVTW